MIQVGMIAVRQFGWVAGLLCRWWLDVKVGGFRCRCRAFDLYDMSVRVWACMKVLPWSFL